MAISREKIDEIPDGLSDQGHDVDGRAPQQHDDGLFRALLRATECLNVLRQSLKDFFAPDDTDNDQHGFKVDHRLCASLLRMEGEVDAFKAVIQSK